MKNTINEQANYIKELRQKIEELDTSTREQMVKYEKATSKKINVPIAVQVYFPCNLLPSVPNN